MYTIVNPAMRHVSKGTEVNAGQARTRRQKKEGDAEEDMICSERKKFIHNSTKT